MDYRFEDQLRGLPVTVTAQADAVPLRFIGRRKLENALLDASLEAMSALTMPREGLVHEFNVGTTHEMPNGEIIVFKLTASFADAELMQGGESFAGYQLTKIVDAGMDIILMGQKRAVRRTWCDEWIASWMDRFTGTKSRDELEIECKALRRVLEADPPTVEDVLKGVFVEDVLVDLDCAMEALADDDLWPFDMRTVLERVPA